MKKIFERLTDSPSEPPSRDLQREAEAELRQSMPPGAGGPSAGFGSSGPAAAGFGGGTSAPSAGLGGGFGGAPSGGMGPAYGGQRPGEGRTPPEERTAITQMAMQDLGSDRGLVIDPLESAQQRDRALAQYLEQKQRIQEEFMLAKSPMPQQQSRYQLQPARAEPLRPSKQRVRPPTRPHASPPPAPAPPPGNPGWSPPAPQQAAPRWAPPAPGGSRQPPPGTPPPPMPPPRS